jgi:hypothetical protein
MFHLLCIYVSLVVLVRQRRGIDFGTCVVHLDRPEREVTMCRGRVVLWNSLGTNPRVCRSELPPDIQFVVCVLHSQISNSCFKDGLALSKTSANSSTQQF